MSGPAAAADGGASGHSDAVPPLVRRFLRQEYAEIDPKLPEWLKVLSDVGAGECWHKASTFQQHLLKTYKILKLWGQPPLLCDCMLFHSAYSNSYVNLAIFKAGSERARVAALVGPETEALIHTFCVVPRHELVYEKLLHVLSDEQLDEAPAGVSVKHIKTGEPLWVDRTTLAQFLIMTMADFSDQLYGWQDEMFENADGKLHYAGNRPAQLWPGPFQPGLWHSALSRMGRLVRACFAAELRARGGDPAAVPFAVPPVFEHCTALLPEAQLIASRDGYWRAVCEHSGEEQFGAAERLLLRAAEANPHVAEPLVLLAQICLHRREYERGGELAGRALRLLATWGSAWDKRMSWEAWVAWARVLLQGARARSFASSAFGMLNLGLVDGL